MNNDRLFLDVHAIQTVPPSNINRDDTGSPKTAQYGGVRRSRVSSQAWKRAIRTYFNENGDTANVGVRTKKIVRYVADKIMALDASKSEKDALSLATKAINAAGIKTKDVDGVAEAKALFFLGDEQANNLAKAAIEGVDDKKRLKEILKANPAVDIALFGRMVADDPSLNEDASCQVAHAISTHGVQTEFDFFTAVDDMAPEDNAGAGMLGTVEYNSSTLYRYGNIAVHELARQLGDREQTINAIALFVESFVNSMPTGKINTFANQTLPQALVVTLRSDRPVNLISAYEEPVRSKAGYVKKSVDKLFEEMRKTEAFVESPKSLFYIAGKDIEGPSEGREEDLSDLLDDLKNALNSYVE
ncbi:MAG: type I-E CRISPR-associated protein Cas7/Cse4/CasC [Peptoniphilus sp.]|nr:type I-E CRISPR-associated protein Cas7/Cse4/CasC [Peptoniphilus sp.]MDD7363428.1 type I-E CRISPR-associated protein Cas7/Cse4/CasC [Bacillota bacterium]MDY6044430.1 type I-E CRISPR-associated protein Cas7/Cse4/CasC [Peptoniphilus sp.]